MPEFKIRLLVADVDGTLGRSSLNEVLLRCKNFMLPACCSRSRVAGRREVCRC
jgi:hypothetical protein